MPIFYANVGAAMRRALPELSPQGTEVEFDDLAPYEAVDIYLNPLVAKAVRHGDELLLERIFILVECMAASEDPEVANLVWVGVCEYLGGEKSDEILRACRRHMGPLTRDISDQVELTMHGRHVVLTPAGREMAQRKVSELRAALAGKKLPDEKRRVVEEMLERFVRALSTRRCSCRRAPGPCARPVG